MRKTRSLPPDYFEDLYRAERDPWAFETSLYEQAKYAATIAALGDARATNALEIGCSIGVLTERLAQHCDRLLAVDVSETALAAAKARCRDLPQVTFAQAQIPRTPVAGAFDLIVLSEVAYYWDAADMDRVAAMLLDQTFAGSRLLLVHWLGETDYPMSGDAAVTALRARLGGGVMEARADRTADYRLDLWRRV
jgi:predicted TPR repeat methyltransferase